MSIGYPEYQVKIYLDIAISTSMGQLHKYISELMASGLNWDMIKTMIQERFSECGSSIMCTETSSHP